MSSSPLHRNLWLGGCLALVSAMSFSLNLVLAGMSYQYGANVHALNLCRALLFLACLGSVILVSGRTITLPTRARLSCLLLGVLLCAEMYAILLAIRTIPVALAVLLFYTYPILIACVSWARGVETFRLGSLFLLTVAFIGLVVVLADGPIVLDFAGTIYALAAAGIMAAMLITSESSLKNHDNFVVLLHAVATVSLLIGFFSISLVPLQWPSGPTGWTVFWASSGCYVIATFTLFKAVALAGPLRTAIIDNTSPVWAALFGFLLLEQFLSTHQVAGVLVVVSAVIALQLFGHKNSPD